MTESTLTTTAALLGEVFPGAPISSEPYLRWLYADSPFGAVIEVNRSDQQGPTAHYAVVPVALSIDGSPIAGALSLNTAVHERARGGGVFVALAEETFGLAKARGIQVIIGVANANSTPGFERRLGFTNHGPLPASVLLPTLGGRASVQHEWVSSTSTLLDGAGSLLEHSRSGLTRIWTEETLRWRLARPNANYALHRSGDALLITTTDRRGGVKVSIVLAAFASRRHTPAEARALVRKVCRFHRTPFALHVGFNPDLPFRGPALPRALRASPLNLISRALDDTAVAPAGRFEFLEFDAY